MPTTIAAWFGLVVAIGGALLAFALLAARSKAAFPAAFLALLIGLPLMEIHRLEKILFGDLGEISFAKEQAQADASEIAEIKKRIEGQAATIDLVAQEAARAKSLSEEAQKAVDRATQGVASLEQDQRDRLEVGALTEIDWQGNRNLGGMGTSTGWSDWHRDRSSEPNKFYVRQKGQTEIEWDCDEKAVAHYRAAVAKYPRFPFPPVVLASCLKKNGASEAEWRPIAEEAASTLRKVIKLPGHRRDYEAFLKVADGILGAETTNAR